MLRHKSFKFVFVFLFSFLTCFLFLAYLFNQGVVKYTIFDNNYTKPLEVNLFMNRSISDLTDIPQTNHFFAWIPHFDFKRGFQGYLNNKDYLNEVHYAGISISADGNLIFSQNFESDMQELSSIGKNFGINIHSASLSGLSKFLEKGYLDFVNNIYSLKEKYPYLSSLNLNFELLNRNDRYVLINFIKNLYFDFSKNKIKLFFTIFGPSQNKINSNLTLDILREQIFYLTEYLDYLVIMFYDFSLNKNNKFGISPYFWLNDFLLYLKNQNLNVNLKKFVIGLPFYGYEYTSNGFIIKSFTYDQISIKIKSNNIYKDNFTDESYIQTSENNKLYFLTLEDQIKRIKIANNYGINKFFFWRLSNSKYVENEIIKIKAF